MFIKLLLGVATGLGIFLAIRVFKESQIVEIDLSGLPQKRGLVQTAVPRDPVTGTPLDLSSFVQTVDDNLLPIFLPPLGAL